MHSCALQLHTLRPHCHAFIAILDTFVAYTVHTHCMHVQVFSDRDILEPGPAADRVASALETCDVFFGSLLFDFDQVRP